MKSFRFDLSSARNHNADTAVWIERIAYFAADRRGLQADSLGIEVSLVVARSVVGRSRFENRVLLLLNFNAPTMKQGLRSYLNGRLVPFLGHEVIVADRDPGA